MKSINSFLVAGVVSVLIAQPAFSQVTQVTGVRLNSTANGLEVILDTAGTNPIITTSSYDQTLLIDVLEAQLVSEFRQENPLPGITSITVTPLYNNSVRVTIKGETTLPIAQVTPNPQGIAISVAGTPETAQVPEISTPEPTPTPEVPETPTPTTNEEFELVVTGAQDRYRVPDASTATRTDTPILDVPQAIQVVPQQVLEDQQITRVDDALRNVSGVVGRLDAFGSNSTLTIRGFSTDAFTAGPILRDGFRIYDNLGVQETANLERIEVLKGPSSVLYGQNDPGGIINLVTKQPLAEPFYNLEFQAGSFGLIRPSLDISGPLTEDGTVRYRLNAVYQREDGFRDFETLNERFFVAPVLSWDISDRTTLSFYLEYLDDKAPFDTGLAAFRNGVIDVPSSRIVNEPDDFRHSQSLTLGYNLEHQFSDNWTLRNAFRYVKQDYDVQVYLPFFFEEDTGILTRLPAIRRYHSDDYSLQTNIVGNFATGSVKHTLLAGVDLNWNRFDEAFTKIDFANASPLNVFNPAYGLVPRPNFDSLVPLPPFDTENDRLGVFLQDQISLTDNFILVGSLRYDSVDYRNTAEGTSFSETAWSPRVGVVYQPTENISLYASYSQSFTPSLALDADRNFLEPQTAKGLEVGVKAELLGDNLLATLAYFDITKQNVPTVADLLTGASVATGEQRSQGIELDVSGEIVPGWNVIGFYAYTDARVTEDNLIPVGNRLPNAPEHSTGLWTTYEIQNGDLQGLGFGLGVNYVSNRFGNLDNDFEIGDYFLTNAAIFYRRNNWRVGLNVNNLFDVGYISSSSSNRTVGIIPGEPLSIVGSISVEF